MGRPQGGEPLLEEVLQATVDDDGTILNFPSAELTGHEGQLVLGSQGAGHVVICSGRSHAYQGFTLAEVSTSDLCAQW